MPMSAPTLAPASLPTPPPTSAPSAMPLAVPPAEAGRMLSLKLSSVYALMRAGELRSFAAGGARRITVASIHEYIARQLADNAEWKRISPMPPPRHRKKSGERA
jgi:excisionase family DNA binding protein